MLAGSAIFMNISSIHSPIPVFLSGVKLSAKLNPHGPAHTVSDAFVTATTPFACTSSGDHEGAPIFSGWPGKQFRRIRRQRAIRTRDLWRMAVVTAFRFTIGTATTMRVMILMFVTADEL
jgi:hypothetical protein